MCTDEMKQKELHAHLRNEKFPISMWDYLISQAVVTLNLLQKINLHAQLCAWAHCDGQFNCNAALIGPPGCSSLIHEPVLNS